jgi:hypothetical protein
MLKGEILMSLRTRPKILEKPEKDIHGKIWPEGFYKAYAWVHT